MTGPRDWVFDAQAEQIAFEQGRREREIAQTIIEQAAAAFVSLGGTQARPLALPRSDDGPGGVQFRVGRGGWVARVRLTFEDLYDVEFATVKSGRIGYTATGVFADQLTETLIRGGDEVAV